MSQRNEVREISPLQQTLPPPSITQSSQKIPRGLLNHRIDKNGAPGPQQFQPEKFKLY